MTRFQLLEERTLVQEMKETTKDRQNKKQILRIQHIQLKKENKEIALNLNNKRNARPGFPSCEANDLGKETYMLYSCIKDVSRKEVSRKVDEIKIKRLENSTREGMAQQ